jgi:hypothetical protein
MEIWVADAAGQEVVVAEGEAVEEGGNAIYQRFFCSSIRVGFITLETFFHEMRS